MLHLLASFTGALCLLLLPGAWLAFGLPLQPISFTARLAIAGALSPFIVPLQFYLVRLLGAPFESAVWIVLLLNLGSIWLVARRWKDLSLTFGALAAFMAVFLLLTGCALIPWATTDSYRLYYSHQWMHSAIVYEFSAGRLIPEEPEMAGVPLHYPWMAHVYWAVLSSTMNVAPTRTYVLTNFFTLLWICILVYETCRARGAPPFAGLSAILWMALGTGAGGYYLWKIIGGRMHGDIRYTPWLRKFSTFDLSKFALAMFAATALLAVLSLQKPTWSRLLLIAISLFGIGLVYPVIFPAAAGFCGVLLLLLAREAWSSKSKPEWNLVIGFLAGLLVVGLISLAHVRWLTAGGGSTLVVASPLISMVAKMGTGMLALLPLLLGASLLGWKRLTEKGNLLFLGGAIPGFLCYALLRVSGAYNEYKFILVLAVCLAPLACLALERWPARIPISVAVILSAAFFFPVIFVKESLEPEFAKYPKTEDWSVALRLAAGEEDRNWTDAVRESTPLDTIVVIRRAGLFYPALVERSLLGPPEQTRRIPGYWMGSRFNLVDVRGYPAKLVEKRENLLRRIFDCDQKCNPEAIAEELDVLQRPVAFVFYPAEGSQLRAWLAQNHLGTSVHSVAAGPAVWLYQPQRKPQPSRR
jgi:hypothetical protein